MINYFLCIIYIFLFLFSLYFWGSIFFKNTKSIPLRIVYTYLIYKFFTSTFGCIFQLLKLPFNLYFIIMIILWFSGYGYALYKKKKEKIVIKKNNHKELFKRYYFVLVIGIILIFFSMINIQYHWFGNHLDDGLYVNVVSDYAKGVDTFKIHAANGLQQVSKFGPHSLNTWQIEAAFYVKLFHVEPVVLLAFGQSFINYVLFCLVILAFLEKILSKEILKKYKYQLQFIPIVTLLFMFQFDVMNRIVHLQDGWQFGNAMFYGSTIIRTMGIFLLLLPIIDKEKISIKDLFIYGCISFILLAQSSVGLPVVVLTAIAYFASHLYFDKKNKLILLITTLIIIIMGIILPNIKLIDNHAINLFRANQHSIVLFSTLIVFMLGYLYKNKLINKVNTIILLLIGFIYIPEVNDITENLSMYDFVEARMWTGIFYVIAILAFTYGFILLCKILSTKKLVIAKSFLAFLLILGVSLSFFFKYGNPLRQMNILRKNPLLLPKSTIMLGEELEKIHEIKNDHLYVMTHDWVTVNGYGHSLSVLLRQHTPNSSIISAIPRYGNFINKEFKGFSQKDDDSFNTFMRSTNSETYKDAEKTLNKYPINCVVSTNLESTKYLEKSNFKLEKKICENDVCYYIHYKKK